MLSRSLQEQRGQLGRFFGTLRRAQKAAANVNRSDSVMDGDGNDDPPAYSPAAISPREWMPTAKSPTSAPRPTRKWSSKILLSPDAKRQLSRELIDAAADGDLKLVDELWSKGGDVNYQSQSEVPKKSRMTAVHAAIWEGHLHVLEGLVDRDAKLDKVMDGGLTALHIAACQDYPEIVKFLLERGVDADAKDDLGETALFGVSEQMTRLLLDAKANVGVRNNELATPLHKASYVGYANVVKALLASGAEVGAQDKYGKTALHYACDCSEEVYIQERVILVSSLLEAGASPNIPARETNRTPLHQAVQSGHVEIVDLLLGADVNFSARQISGYTAVHFAAELDSAAILNSLIKPGADVKAQTFEKKYTPLHCAVMKGQPQCTEALIQASSNIEARCSKGFTALHYASAGTSPETIKALLAASANPYAKDLNNETPLHCVRELPEAVEMLLGAMASIDARDAREATPLHTVVQYGSLKAVKILLDHEAQTEAVNSKKQTPLEALCSNEKLWVINVDEQTDAKEVQSKEDSEDAEEPEVWETEIRAPWEIRLDIVQLLLEKDAKVSKDCVKAVVAWEADQPKATVLAALCLKTTGMIRLMILTNRAVIASGILSLIHEMESAMEKRTAEKKDTKAAKELEKGSKKSLFGKKKEDGMSKVKSEEKSKGKQDTEAGKKSKKEKTW
jgi:ankyrin repeat protein